MNNWLSIPCTALTILALSTGAARGEDFPAPVGEKAPAWTAPAWPPNSASTSPSAAFQTLVAKRRKREADPDAPAKRPLFLNTCHAHASDSPEVKRRWPAFYTGPDSTS